MSIPENFYAAVGRDINNGVAVLELDGRIEWCNSRFAQLFGRAADECLGLGFPAGFENGHSDSLVSAELLRGIQTGKGVSGLRQTLSDRHGIAVELYINLIPLASGVAHSGAERFVVYLREAGEPGHTSKISAQHQALFEDTLIMRK